MQIPKSVEILRLIGGDRPLTIALPRKDVRKRQKRLSARRPFGNISAFENSLLQIGFHPVVVLTESVKVQVPRSGLPIIRPDSGVA